MLMFSPLMRLLMPSFSCDFLFLDDAITMPRRHDTPMLMRFSRRYCCHYAAALFRLRLMLLMAPLPPALFDYFLIAIMCLRILPFTLIIRCRCRHLRLMLLLRQLLPLRLFDYFDDALLILLTWADYFLSIDADAAIFFRYA